MENKLGTPPPVIWDDWQFDTLSIRVIQVLSYLKFGSYRRTYISQKTCKPAELADFTELTRYTQLNLLSVRKA